jgi:hypothetical protein
MRHTLTKKQRHTPIYSLERQTVVPKKFWLQKNSLIFSKTFAPNFHLQMRNFSVVKCFSLEMCVFALVDVTNLARKGF